jgi:sigma-B regulation protein RsbU (phosphoserine phosphatase)
VNFNDDRLVVNPAHGSAWDLGAFRMLTESRSASGNLGGDFFAFRLRGPKRLAVVIGDACGRGKEAASLLPGVLARVERLASTMVRPSHFLAELNAGLFGELSSDRFVTGAAFEIDADAGTLTIANAAHVPAVLRRANGEVTLVGRASGPPLGILRDSSYFEETYRFNGGDVMVLMTDGIVEAVESDLTEMPRLTALVAATDGGSPAVHRRVLERLAQQVGRDADDMTLLSLELLSDVIVPSAPDFKLAV